MADNDQLELFITDCFRIRLDAYYYAHKCISENCLSHKKRNTRTELKDVGKTVRFHTLLRILTEKAFMNGNKRVLTCSTGPLSHGLNPAGFKWQELDATPLFP